jgi:hypothetical protein
MGNFSIKIVAESMRGAQIKLKLSGFFVMEKYKSPKMRQKCAI